MADDKPTMEDTMGAVFDKMQAEPVVETIEAPVVETVEATVEPVVETETEEQKAQRVRDEAGRFAKTPKEAKAKVVKPAEVKPVETPEKIEGATQPATTPNPDLTSSAEGFKPPAGWSAAAKAEWAKLPPAVQAAVFKREDDANKGFAQYEGIGKALNPVRDWLSQNGLAAPEYVNRLVQADLALRHNPKEALAWIVRNYGIDPASLNQTQPGPSVDPNDPIAVLQQEIAQLRNGIITSQRNASESQRAQFETQATNDVDAFRADTKNEFFDVVREDMGRIYATAASMKLPMPSLQSAYDQAIWANPNTRPHLIAREQQKIRTQQETEAKARASSAIRSATTLVKGNQGTTPAPKASLEEEMAQVYDAVSSRAA